MVTVVNPNGLEGSLLGGFLYLQILDVSMVVPATGSLAGGNLVELSGSGFQRGATVRFDGVLATDVRVLSPGRISLRTPPGHFGTADVRVDNPDGRYVVKADAFLYSNLVVSRAYWGATSRIPDMTVPCARRRSCRRECREP